MDLIKPLLFWRKYLLANDLLKTCVGGHVTVAAINDIPTYQKEYNHYQLGNYIYFHPKTKPERLLEAADMLAKEKFVTKVYNPDIYKVIITATIEGERASNEGFYVKVLIKKFAWLFGTPIALLLLKSLWQWLQGLKI